MLFTLIVPVFQTPSILQLFLNSLTDTLEFPSQIIFVNDGSGKEINDILTSGDGVNFVICVEWDRTNIIKVLGIAKALGWTFEIIKE